VVPGGIQAMKVLVPFPGTTFLEPAGQASEADSPKHHKPDEPTKENETKREK